MPQTTGERQSRRPSSHESTERKTESTDWFWLSCKILSKSTGCLLLDLAVLCVFALLTDPNTIVVGVSRDEEIGTCFCCKGRTKYRLCPYAHTPWMVWTNAALGRPQINHPNVFEYASQVDVFGLSASSTFVAGFPCFLERLHTWRPHIQTDQFCLKQRLQVPNQRDQ